MLQLLQVCFSAGHACIHEAAFSGELRVWWLRGKQQLGRSMQPRSLSAAASPVTLCSTRQHQHRQALVQPSPSCHGACATAWPAGTACAAQLQVQLVAAASPAKTSSSAGQAAAVPASKDMLQAHAASEAADPSARAGIAAAAQLSLKFVPIPVAAAAATAAGLVQQHFGNSDSVRQAHRAQPCSRLGGCGAEGAGGKREGKVPALLYPLCYSQ